MLVLRLFRINLKGAQHAPANLREWVDFQLKKNGNLMKKYIILIIIAAFAWVCAAQEKISVPAEPGFWQSIANFFLPHADARQILLEKQTLYFLVTVEKGENGWRHLVFNPNRGSQGIWNPESPDELLSNYCKYTALFMQGIDQHPRKVLFIGLGAGIMPRFVRKISPATGIDIVEIDGEIPGIAEQYFGFKKDDKINITIGDGRDLSTGIKPGTTLFSLTPTMLKTFRFSLRLKNFSGRYGNR